MVSQTNITSRITDKQLLSHSIINSYCHRGDGLFHCSLLLFGTVWPRGEFLVGIQLRTAVGNNKIRPMCTFIYLPSDATVSLHVISSDATGYNKLRCYCYRTLNYSATIIVVGITVIVMYCILMRFLLIFFVLCF